MIDKVREASGEKHFILPNTFSAKRCKDEIMLTIKPVNIDYVGMTHVYDIDWKFPITKYAFIFYRYVLNEKGKVVIDIEGKKELPIYDFHNSSMQGDYFLLLYRLLKLEKCYPWIVLSDIIKKVVLLVLMTEQQENVFFKEWMEFSEQVVEKVKIMRRNEDGKY